MAALHCRVGRLTRLGAGDDEFHGHARATDWAEPEHTEHV